jgi:hypothetical protein
VCVCVLQRQRGAASGVIMAVCVCVCVRRGWGGDERIVTRESRAGGAGGARLAAGRREGGRRLLVVRGWRQGDARKEGIVGLAATDDGGRSLPRRVARPCDGAKGCIGWPSPRAARGDAPTRV